MALRDDLFQQFGPKLAECLFDYQLELLNELRREQGHPEVTKNDYLTLLTNHITEIPDYEWQGT